MRAGEYGNDREIRWQDVAPVDVRNDLIRGNQIFPGEIRQNGEVGEFVARKFRKREGELRKFRKLWKTRHARHEIEGRKCEEGLGCVFPINTSSQGRRYQLLIQVLLVCDVDHRV